MSKYDKMLALNKKASEEKIATAKMVIQRMLEEEEKITVSGLIRCTGLSQGFFYKNLIVRKEVEQAIARQAGKVCPRKKIIDKAMDSRVIQLQVQVEQLKKENENLKKENQKLYKAL